ncbi:hypothetical protein FCULG_00012766 [Fusarium culmorum]|uniref:Uncharacterized protein n=1 Tax=Fusarium culmorum TaxID=5516 RepID=A0A2T4GG30_FUSCU|nr:hypothetical protein FCULG_00012971 [Fusarium culmorum]PTD02489.1 hypothetical protein FCULG_00012847 [Fusarium culmorum]PTD02554.1 hypothetical protein FCULG_00012564 [Fusarium culmorum]PTD03437.1 hypothetical protein FCULG_00012766 [Fusarium culmorum]
MFSERFGKHGRVFITPEKPDMSAILESERTGSFIVDWHRDMAEQKAKETEREVGPGKRKFLWNRADEEYAQLLANRFKEAGGRTLVLVSAGGEMRDQLRQDVRKYLDAGFELEELEYQPS